MANNCAREAAFIEREAGLIENANQLSPACTVDTCALVVDSVNGGD